MKPADAALCVLVMSIWASNVVAARFTVLELPGWFTITIRMLIIAVTLVPFVRFPRRHIGKIAALSVTMGTGHFGLMYVALQNISGGAAALILQTAVPFAAHSCLAHLSRTSRLDPGLRHRVLVLRHIPACR